MEDKKIVLFAATPSDAVDYCKNEGLDFTKVTWVMNYQLLGEKGLTDADEARYTDLFMLMPAYAEAVAGWNKDKGE